MMVAPATSNAGAKRNVAALPILPNDANINPQLLSRLQAAVERIATLDGQRGDQLDAALTRRDLVEVGILKTGKGGSGIELDSGFSGGWTSIPYLDAMPTPDAPTFKTGIGVNFLFWKLPNARGVGATQIFRRTTDADGLIVASPVGAMYADLPVDYGVTYYYKIRFVSEKGVAGDWSTEVKVLAEEDPSYTIKMMQGKVDSSLLAQGLRERVDAGGIIDQAINAETQARVSALLAEAAARDAAITNEATTRNAADENLAQSITTLTSNMTDEFSRQTAALQNETTARTTADASLAQSINTLAAQTSTKLDTVTATITAETTARTTADTSLAQSITSLTSTVNNNQAALVANYYTKVDANSAIASSTRSLASKVFTLDANGNPQSLDAGFSESIKTTVDASGVAKATFSSKVTANGRTAGFSYGSDGNISEFYINADRFAILSYDGSTQTTPFIVSGGNTYIDSAVIKDASITGAKIAEATITAANIASLDVMEVAVGGTINSSNYNPTTKTGWVLNQDGSAGFYGDTATFGGKLEVRRVGSGAGVDITNDGIRVYDSNGVLRVTIGSLV